MAREIWHTISHAFSRAYWQKKIKIKQKNTDAEVRICFPSQTSQRIIALTVITTIKGKKNNDKGHSELRAIETWESFYCIKQYGNWIWVRNYLEFILPNNDFLSGGLKTTLSFPGTIRPPPLVFSGSNIIVVLSKSIGPPLPPCFWKMQKFTRMFLVKHLSENKL